MFYVLQNETVAARKRCPILLTDSATGTTGQSGLAISNIYAYVSINGGAFAGAAGTVRAVNFGQYYYEFDISEINTLGLAGIHVTAPGCRDYDAIVQVAAFNMYSAAGAGLTAGDVWSYGGGRTTTGGIADTVLNPVDVTTASMTGIANTTWDTDVSAFTSPSAGYDLTQAATGGAGISAYDVWEYDISGVLGTYQAGYELLTASTNTGNIVSTTNDINTNTQAGAIALSVWGNDLAAGANSPYAAGTAGTILYDLSLGGSGLTAGDVWEYDISAISTAGTAGSQLNLAASPSGSGLTAGDVWDFVITGFGQTGSAAEYSTQTLFNTGNIESYVQTQTPQDIWTYAGIEGRTITGGTANTVTTVTNPVSVSTTSMTGIANTVWSTLTAPYTTHATFGHQILRSDNAATIGEVTLHQSGGSKRVDADVHAFVNNTASATAMLNILTGIGSSMTTNITGNLSGSVGSVTNAVNVSTSSMSGIANTVWSTDVSSYVSPSAGYDLSNATAGGGITAGDVWSYATREITGGIADTVTTVSGNVLGSVLFIVDDVTLSAGTQASIANSVWSTDVSGYASPSAGYDLSNATAGGGITAGDVWTYATRTITGGIADTVTTLTNKSGFAITGGTVDTVTNGVTVSTNNDKTGYSLSGTQTFNVTGNITGNVSGSVGSVSGAVGSVTGNVGGNVVGSVASVTNPVTFNSGQYASIASSVWNAGTRTLTSGGGSGISAYDVWNFVLSDANTAEVDLVQAASGSGLTAGDVWTYGTRTITGGIANTVTSVTNGVTVTTNNDKTGYALSGAGVSAVQSGLSTLTQAQVGTEVDSSLSDVGLTTTVTGRIDATVSSRLASASYTAPPTEAAIAGTVWSYTPRTLTSGAGATAGDVWTYPTRSLTSGAGITVNAATNIINGPYFVKSNVDGQDGTLDVIRGMVQDIQLTVTDAFQNPFDTTALGLAVNFYDQAGTLVTSYATTELYGPAGLVQFTLNTAVTGVEGRYNLILSAAGAGNTIKFGPLQTLVRPF